MELNDNLSRIIKLADNFLYTPIDETDLYQKLKIILQEIMDIFNMDAGAIYIKNDVKKTLDMFVEQGYPKRYIKHIKSIIIGVGFGGRAAQAGEIRISHSMKDDPRFARLNHDMDIFNSFISVPIKDGVDCFGIINLVSKKQKVLSFPAKELLDNIGKKMANLLINYKTFAERSKRERLIKGLFNIAIEIQTIHEVEKICHILSEETAILFNADYFMINIVSPNNLENIAQSGFQEQKDLMSVVKAISKELSLQNINSPIKFWESNIRHLFKNTAINKSLQPKYLYVLPLEFKGVKQEFPSGFITLGYKEVKDFAEEEKALDFLASCLMAALSNIIIHQEINKVIALKERRWLAREMHDSVSQLISSARMEIEKIRTIHNEKDEISFEILNNIDEILKQAYRETRENILNLGVKFDEGFTSMLNKVLKEFENKTKINTIKSIPKHIKITPFLEVHLLRIIQEALTNVKNHSKATVLEFKLKIERKELLVFIKDNGCGFLIEESSSFGLAVMQERTELLGGKIKISSTPGKGTTINAKFPIAAKNPSVNVFSGGLTQED